MSRFIKAISSEEVDILLQRFPPVGTEIIPIEAAIGRVAAAKQNAPEDLPHFNRSTMDGYAVKAADLLGASESAPIYLRRTGEVLMGSFYPERLAGGCAVAIGTGGALPDGADAVIMVEYTEELIDGTIEITKQIAPGDHIIRRGDDIKTGTTLLERGRRLRPSDVAALAALGLRELPVHRRVKVGIISTGDELVSHDQQPAIGQIRDANQPALQALVMEARGQPISGGIIQDQKALIANKVQELLAQCDLVLISGGSSVGVRDHTGQILAELGEPGVLCHGIAIRPGKPTIIAAIGDKPVIGMPGHPVSSLVIASRFVSTLIKRLEGEQNPSPPWPLKVMALFGRDFASANGREDYIRVTLEEREGKLWATPLLGGSAAITTMVKSDGLVKVPATSEGLAEGEVVEVMKFD